MSASNEHPPAFYWPRRDLAILLAITAAGAVLRLFRLQEWSLSVSEAATWRAVTEPLWGAHGLFASEQGLYPLAFLGERWLFDAGVLPFLGEGWWRLPFAFFGMLTVPLLALVSRRLVGSPAALLASGTLALHPWHIEASQTAAPAVVALFFVLLAAAAALRLRDSSSWWWRVGSAALVALAGACHASGWSAALAFGGIGLAARWSRLPRSRRRLGAVALAAGTIAVAWWCARLSGSAHDTPPWFAAIGLPTIVLAAVGVLRAPRALAVAAATPLATLFAARVCFGPVPTDHVLVALPAWALLAAVGALHCYVILRDALPAAGPGAALGARVVAALVAIGLASSLAIATFLQATVYQGNRPPWRQAANVALGLVGTHAGLRVGAGAGTDVLSCYLRPNHWRESARDPHPGIEVLRLALPAEAAFDELVAGAGDVPIVLVLRHDELAALDASPARTRLQQSFALERVLPCPQPRGDETIYVFRWLGSR